MLYSPSLLSRASENGSCSLLATWAAVPGISCISPRAPTELCASVRKRALLPHDGQDQRTLGGAARRPARVVTG